eukprot:2442015-Pyramimonas_sp.AAC.1
MGTDVVRTWARSMVARSAPALRCPQDFPGCFRGLQSTLHEAQRVPRVQIASKRWWHFGPVGPLATPHPHGGKHTQTQMLVKFPRISRKTWEMDGKAKAPD